MEQLASSFALEDSPGEPEGEEGEHQKLLHKKPLRLGETASDDEDNLPETHGSLETKKTLDYTELSKKVGYFNLQLTSVDLLGYNRLLLVNPNNKT